MVFIDGGNQELIGAPNFSIQLNRIYFNILQRKETDNTKGLAQ